MLELFKGLLKGPLRLKDPGAWDASEAACHVDLGGKADGCHNGNRIFLLVEYHGKLKVNLFHNTLFI